MQTNPYDIVIIGGGPAGLTAGIYAARSNMNTLLIESAFSPSLITTTDMVENYPGFPDGISGLDLNESFRRQAGRFGLVFLQTDVTALAPVVQDGQKYWKVEAEEEFLCRALIIATGAQHAKLGVPGEAEFLGRGVSYCATCDAFFYRDKKVVVVGGGDTAVQEALYLTKFASHVTLVHRRDSLRATAILQDRAKANERIEIAWNSTVEEILGEKSVNGVRLKDVKTGSTRDLATDGVFVFVGYQPNGAIAQGVVETDAGGYIRVNENMQTSAAGVFACGDCTGKLLRQVVTACGDGATAAFAAEHYIEQLKGMAYPPRHI